MAFHGSVTQPIRSYSEPDLWVMDVASECQPRNLTADYDFDMGGPAWAEIMPRHVAETVRPCIGRRMGRALIDVVAKQGRSQLGRMWMRSLAQ